MKFPCYCGQGINLKQKEVQKVLLEEELFCSLACLYKFIVECSFSNANLDKLRKNTYLSTPCECYDSVTKAWYRSMFEVYAARFFKDKGLSYLYEPHTLLIGSKTYTPDFYLSDYNLHLECKGPWAIGSKQKYLIAREQINIILLPAYMQNIFKKEYGLKNEVIK